ncbi:hypothetical protein D9M69_419830 [compost metagenome]
MIVDLPTLLAPLIILTPLWNTSSYTALPPLAMMKRLTKNVDGLEVINVFHKTRAELQAVRATEFCAR